MKRIVVFALVLNAALLGVIAQQLVAIAGGGPVATQNGDTNGDGARDITDAIYYLSWLFQGGAEPVAIAQQGGNDEAIEGLRAQIEDLQSGSRLLNAVVLNNTLAIAGLRDQLAEVAGGGLSDEQSEILGHMSIEQLPVDDDGNTAKAIRFTGVNVQVVNGNNTTGEDVNGLGNLIVGYQELRKGSNNRSGSHNLVVGTRNNYSIWGGQVVGSRNTISGSLATVSGGRDNIASAAYSTVSGGIYNSAPGTGSTVSGGVHNTAGGDYSTVSGGDNNTASVDLSTVSGGFGSTAGGRSSTVSGGYRNTAEGDYSTVSGGLENTAPGSWSTASGGFGNMASGDVSTVSGGQGNTAARLYSTVSGGQYNMASQGHWSTVSGGRSNRASAIGATVSGGLDNTASGTWSTVSGGMLITAENPSEHQPATP